MLFHMNTIHVQTQHETEQRFIITFLDVQFAIQVSGWQSAIACCVSAFSLVLSE